MKVVIFGAGISGLTVAHELVEKGYDIEIYEKDSIAGGMARSFRYENGVPTEHSWRGYGPFYHNTFEIMKRIPLDSKENFSNQYTLEQVRKHNKEDDLWTIYRGNIYDITYFVKSHPGGKSNILKCGGKDVEKVWKNLGYDFHINDSHIISHLTRNKIGSLVEGFKNSNRKKTVFDNLNKNKLKFKYLYNEAKGRGEPNLNIYDTIFLFFLFGKVICSDKRKHEYFNIRLDPIIKKNLSKEGYHFISDFIAGPGWGFDKKTMSLGHYALFVEYSLYEKERNWQVMNKPTSEAWIEPWVKYLKSKGVKFNFNSELVKVNIEKKNVNNCEVKIKKSITNINSDIYVFALNPFNFEDILKNSKRTNSLIYKKLLKANTINNQISFRLGFNKKIDFGMKATGFVLIDSQYNITFYPQEDSWEPNVKLGMDGKIKTLISGTIILPYNKGLILKKSATSLKLDELKEEIIEQIFASKDFLKYTQVSKVGKDNIIFKEIFKDWYEDGNYLKSKNRKWVNNKFNENYRLKHKTNINNMFICGSHCKTSINIWSMEGAVESGKICSNEILKGTGKNIKIYKHGSKGIVLLLQSIENIFYALQLRNVIIELIVCLFIYIIFKLVIKCSFLQSKKHYEV